MRFPTLVPGGYRRDRAAGLPRWPNRLPISWTRTIPYPSFGGGPFRRRLDLAREVRQYPRHRGAGCAKAGTGESVDDDHRYGVSVNTGNAELRQAPALRRSSSTSTAFRRPRTKAVKVHFKDGAAGGGGRDLTLHGVSHPLTLTLLSFKCYRRNPIAKKEVCGTEATGKLRPRRLRRVVRQGLWLSLEDHAAHPGRRHAAIGAPHARNCRPTNSMCSRRWPARHRPSIAAQDRASQNGLVLAQALQRAARRERGVPAGVVGVAR